MEIIFIFIIFFSVLIGSVCGMGGGVIIKPLFDAVGPYSTFQIAVISGACVLAMAIAALIKHAVSKTPVKPKPILLLSGGAVLGGVAGDFLFNAVRSAAVVRLGDGAENLIKVIQNAALFALLLFVLCYMLFLKPKGKHFSFKNPAAFLIAGTALGVASTFLDIGGGPINICALCLFFGFSTKEAAVHSLATIFFAQTAKFVTLAGTGAFVTNVVFDAEFPGWILGIMVVTAVAGGLIGAFLYHKLSDRSVGRVYCAALIAVLCLAVYNAVANAVML